MQKEVIEALGAWILRVADEKRIATPEETAVLPEVAKVFLAQNYDQGVSSRE